MSSTLLERPPLRPDRTKRLRSRERRRKAAALASAAICAIALAASVFLLANPNVGRRATVPPAPVNTRRHTLVLAVRGTPVPLVAVVGGGNGAVAVPLPPDLTASFPGGGELGTEGLLALPGPSLRIAVSNLMGMWVEHYAAIDVASLAAAVDRGGGLHVDLPEAVIVGNQTLGPGPVVMNGGQVRAFLSVASPGPAAVHWDIALSAILADPPSFTDADLSDSDGARGLNQVLAGGTNAEVLTFPTRFVSGTMTLPDYPSIDQLTETRFGEKTPAVPVEVLNGTGGPEAVELVASKIVPLGFRVTLTDDSRDFANQPTRVIANSAADVALAQRVRAAMGTGRLGVSRVPSGLGDVTIVLGRNFRV